MKHFSQGFTYLNYIIFFSFIFLFSTAAFAENNIIRCKTADEKNFRVWRLEFENNKIKLWTLNKNTFYPFCTVGLSIEFSNGLLCAYKKDKKVGTVATFVDIHKPEITDILIREDTILSDPNTWKQKVDTACELIRE